MTDSDSAVRAGTDRNQAPTNDVVVVAANSSWALTNYRLGLLKGLQNAGYRLVAVVPDDDGASKLVSERIEVRFVPIAPHGTSAARELLLLYRYVQLLRELRPRAFLGFTIKPNIYGALAARIARVPVINNVTGLGIVFTRGGLLRGIVGALYRVAFRHSFRVFFQNQESRDLFLSLGFVREHQAHLLPGSGIDLHRFAPGAGRLPAEKSSFTFLLPSRLMWQKGVGEYCEAARWFRSNRAGVRFQLLGAVEPSWNKEGISREQIEDFENEGVEYLGSTDDVRPFFEAADCIVLPSYYPEGVPRALIEAAAMGKPVIATDTPGCRDTVDQGKTGFLCEPRSPDDLVRAMLRVLDLAPRERAAMGRRAREKAERQFDEQTVIEAYLAAIDAIVSKRASLTDSLFVAPTDGSCPVSVTPAKSKRKRGTNAIHGGEVGQPVYDPAKEGPRHRLERRAYAEMNVSGFAHNDQEVGFYVQVAALLRPEHMVLDFGAGRGEFMDTDPSTYRVWLQNFRGRCAKVCGCDPDPVVLENPTLDCAAIIELGKRLPYPDEHFDLIVSRYVFEHITDPEWAARELLRVLKPGGWICAMTPNKWSYLALAARLIPNRMHSATLTKVQPGRLERDVFPTAYKLNRPADVKRYFGGAADVYFYSTSGVPSYHFGSMAMMRLQQLMHRLTPPAFDVCLRFFIRKR